MFEEFEETKEGLLKDPEVKKEYEHIKRSALLDLEKYSNKLDFYENILMWYILGVTDDEKTRRMNIEYLLSKISEKSPHDFIQVLRNSKDRDLIEPRACLFYDSLIGE